jgi:uridine kinase
MGKLILIEGMSGSGKSTAAQYLALAISQSGSKSDWYHEEQTNHPIYTEEYDRYLESGQVNKFVTKIISNWEKFLANTREDSVAHIFEADSKTRHRRTKRVLERNISNRLLVL